MSKTIILWSFLFITISLFSFNLFKNISHPLLWNDEAETTMYAERILRFGYPKVHDGKNVLNPIEIPDKSVGVKKSNDAWINLGWFQYYWAAMGVYPAHYFDDFYLKTAIVRIPFALAGLLGTFIFSLTVMVLMDQKKKKILFLGLFFLLENLSVLLILHLREARSYALTYLLTSTLFLIFLNCRVFRSRKYLYFTLLPILMFLMFNNFFPVFIAFAVFFGFYEVVSFLQDINKNTWKKDIIYSHLFFATPILISVILVIPLVWFYEMIPIFREFSKYYRIDINIYIRNLIFILEFLIKQEFLLVLFLLKFMTFLFIGNSKKFIKILRTNKKMQVSYLFLVFLIIYALVIARIPFLFERYLVSMQPVIALSIILDIFLFHEIFVSMGGKAWILIILVVSSFFFAGFFKLKYLRWHFYELMHVYQGPLDFVIPYLRDRFPDSENLVIATNYEELSYMYYLGSRVTVGFVGNNLEEDAKIQPDIIIPRLGRDNSIEILRGFLDKARYKEVSFPVYDYQFNNISELSLVYSHLFKTKLANTDGEKLKIYVKED